MGPGDEDVEPGGGAAPPPLREDNEDMLVVFDSELFDMDRGRLPFFEVGPEVDIGWDEGFKSGEECVGSDEADPEAWVGVGPMLE